MTNFLSVVLLSILSATNFAAWQPSRANANADWYVSGAQLVELTASGTNYGPWRWEITLSLDREPLSWYHVGQPFALGQTNAFAAQPTTNQQVVAVPTNANAFFRVKQQN